MEEQDRLTDEERRWLLRLAREALEKAVRGEELPAPALGSLPMRLREPGATFVTLTTAGELRGCIGALEACAPLAVDVCRHAAAAALDDYRFPPVRPEELETIEIEVSRLTPTHPLAYECADDLLSLIHPGSDGVVLIDGRRRATFLPQVWEMIPDPEQFLGHLCSKMGAPADLWKVRKLQVLVYRVEEFKEQSTGQP